MVFGLGILAILTLGVISMPVEASADRAGYVTPYNSTRYPNVQDNSQYYNSYVGPNTIDYYSTPVVYSNDPGVRTSTNTVVVKEVADTKTVEEKPADETKDESSLASNAIFGSNGFMPSGILQWIFFGILILIVIILIRRVTGATDKYHAEPLKHA